MSQWIKCSDRMPEFDEVVLCGFWAKRSIGERKFKWEFQYFTKRSQDFDREMITHWMPLPEPPND